MEINTMNDFSALSTRAMVVRTALQRSTTVLAFLLLGACAADEPHCIAQSLSVESTQIILAHEDGRNTQVDIWSPSRTGQYPLLIFSHGAYSAPERYDVLLEALASSGYVVAAPLHIDSELLVTGEQPEHDEVWNSRKQDMLFLPGQTAALQAKLSNISIASPEEGYLAAGHSYGAFIAQVLAGAMALGDSALPEGSLQPDAVVAFSPPGPLPGFIGSAAWQGVSVPQLVLTGTADILPGFIDDWREHAIPYEQAQPGEQWLWVGTDVDHYFGNIIGRKTLDVEPQAPQFDDAMEVTRRFIAQYTPSVDSCDEALTTFNGEISRLEKR
jgi:dienelactone hydrolase